MICGSTGSPVAVEVDRMEDELVLMLLRGFLILLVEGVEEVGAPVEEE